MKNIKYTYCLLLLLTAHFANAQVKVGATPTGKHAKVATEAKKREVLTKRQWQRTKVVKEQIQQHKAAKKYYQDRYDSLKNSRLDSLNLPLLTKEDSLQIAQEVMTQTKMPAQYKTLLLEPPAVLDSLMAMSVDSTYFQQWQDRQLDSLLVGKAERLVEQVAREYLPPELSAAGSSTVEGPLTDLQNPLKETVAVKQFKKPNPNMIQTQKAKALFRKVDPERFKAVEQRLQKLKKKYSQLPDLRYPEEGTKRNSLANLSFKKRLYFGGNVSLKSTDPIILDANLQVGYWLRKKWLAGVGFILREQFSQEDTTALVTGDGHGISFFTRYDLPKGFFAWAEGEFQVTRSFFGGEVGTTKSSLEQAYLLGIGREFKVGKVQLMSLVLYDFNYRNNELHARPLVFKVGWRLRSKPKQ